MMTLEEAAKKWCPHAFTFGRLSSPTTETFGPQNRGYQMGGGLSTCMCLGAGCMMWRWSFYEHQRNLDPKDRTPVGYCGLAGRPE
jgi:hypothetical protein